MRSAYINYEIKCNLLPLASYPGILLIKTCFCLNNIKKYLGFFCGTSVFVLPGHFGPAIRGIETLILSRRASLVHRSIFEFLDLEFLEVVEKTNHCFFTKKKRHPTFSMH